MSKHNDLYNILNKLGNLDPKKPTKTAPSKPVYESVDAKGSILAGVTSIEKKLAEAYTAEKAITKYAEEKKYDTNPKNAQWDDAALAHKRKLASQGKQIAMQRKISGQDSGLPPVVKEGNPTSDPWIAYDKENTDKIKKFKTRDGAKAYADKNGWGIASFGHYHDHVKGKQGVTEQQLDEVTGDLPFDTMMSKIVTGGNLQTLAAKIVAKINKFPQHVENDGYERAMPRYPDGHFYGADALYDTFDEVMQQWKKMGPDDFSDEYGEESLFDVLDSSADYTRYWDGILKLRDRLQPMPGALEQLGKMVWHGLFSGSVEQGITDIGRKGVAEGSYKDTSGTFMDRLVGEILNYQSLNNVNPKLNDFSSEVKSKLKSLGEIKAKQIYQQALKQSAELSGKQGVAEGTVTTRKGDRGETIHKHTAKAGGYGRKIDKDDDTGDKFHSSDIDDTDEEPTFPAVKRSRGRPQKGGDSETGKVKKYDTDSLASMLIGKLPKNHKTIGKQSVKHKLKDWIEYVESNMIAEGRLNEAEMKRKLENLAMDLKRKDFVSKAKKYGMTPKDAKEFWNNINGVDGDVDLDEMMTQQPGQTGTPQQGQQPGQTGTPQQGQQPGQTDTAQQPATTAQSGQQQQQQQTQSVQNLQKVMNVAGGHQVVGNPTQQGGANEWATKQQAADQAKQKLQAGGAKITKESKQMKNQHLNESADAKLILEGMSLDEIIELHPHEHKMCQEGWGMDECLYEALCDHYYKEGRIPRKVWHGPLEQLRDFVEECYMQDTQPLIDSTMDEAFIDSTAHELGEEYIDATANEMDEAIDGTFASGDIDEEIIHQEDHAMNELMGELDEEYTKAMKDSGIPRDPVRGFVAPQERSAMNESKEVKMENKSNQWKNAALTSDQINGSQSPDVYDEINIGRGHVIRPALDNPTRSVLKNKLRASAEKEMDKVHNRQRNISTSDVQADESKESTLKRDNRAERAGKKVTKDIEYDMKNKRKVDEKDEGKHNNATTGFKALAKKAAKEYGSKAAGERVAGAVRAKMAKAGKLEESDYDSRDAYDKWDPKHPDFAKNYKKYQAKCEKEGKKATLKDYIASLKKKVKESAKPDFLDIDKDGNKKESMKKASADKKKKVKESVEFSAWERQLESLINEDFTVNTTKSSRPESNSVNVSATGAEADELLAIIQRAGLTGETAQSSMQQAFDNSPDVMAVEVDDDCEDTPMSESSMDECYMEDEATEEALMPAQGDHTVVMAMPLGMGMSQNVDGEQECEAPEAVEQEDIKGIIDQLVGGVDDSGDDSLLSAIKKLIGHGAAEIELVSNANPSADYKSEGDLDEDGQQSAAQQAGIPATGSSMSPMANSAQKPVTEADDEEMEEGAGVMHYKNEQAKKAGKDSFKLGDKEFPVKEDEETVNAPDELESEDQSVSAQNMAGAEFKFEESRGGSLADVLARLDALSDGDTVASKLDEWANSANDQGKDEKFETDVDFMTRSISGGLNNAKQDQTLIGSGQGRVQTSDERGEVKNSIGAMLRKLDGINE